MVESSTSTSSAQPVSLSASTQATAHGTIINSSRTATASPITKDTPNHSDRLAEQALELVDQELRVKLGATSIQAYLAKTAPRRDASVGPLPNHLPPLGPLPPFSLLRTATTQTGESPATDQTMSNVSTPSILGKRAAGAEEASPSTSSPKKQDVGANVQVFVPGVDDIEGVSCISRLNEYAQKNKIDLPVYESVTIQKGVGPTGLKHYVICSFAGMRFEDTKGFTRKQDSKEAAARLALVYLGTRSY